MKILFDTSVLIAGLVEAHPMHKRAFPWLKRAKANEFEMIVASHTIAELYAVLSTLPIKPRITPLIARKLITENIEPNSKIISLSPGEYKSVIKQISELGLAGGVIYDALIARLAQKSKVERLLTLHKVGGSHCTGSRAMQLFKAKYGKNYIQMSVGKVIPLN